MRKMDTSAKSWERKVMIMELILLSKKMELKTAVQAKRYQNIVGIKAVQEVASGKSYYDCDDAIVVTNSHFSKAAKELAEKCGVGLIDREYLKKLYE